MGECLFTRRESKNESLGRSTKIESFVSHSIVVRNRPCKKAITKNSFSSSFPQMGENSQFPLHVYYK